MFDFVAVYADTRLHFRAAPDSLRRSAEPPADAGWRAAARRSRATARTPPTTPCPSTANIKVLVDITLMPPTRWLIPPSPLSYFA